MKASSFRRPEWCEEGRTNDAALRIFFRNSRWPLACQADLRALMAAVSLGAVRMQEIASRFGADVLADALAQLLGRTERTIRDALARTFPVGTHAFTDRIDGDGKGSGPLALRFALTRTADNRFIFDATETDDQSPGPVNYLMNKDVPGMALGLIPARRRSDAGDECRRAARHRRGETARGVVAAAAMAGRARHARA